MEFYTRMMMSNGDLRQCTARFSKANAPVKEETLWSVSW
jgi:hypothetical protein